MTPLSWGQWDPAAWQKVWIYRKHFARPALRPGDRVFADFDGVMTSATVVLNGRVLTAHQGGYLPWSTELAGGVTGGRSVMALIVDSRWLPVPPDGAPAGAGSVDYLQPGGIYRDVTLRVVPGVFLSDVFVRPVLGPGRSVAVQATIDAAAMPAGPVRVTAELRDATAVLGTGSALVTVTGTGTTVAGLSITGIGGVTPWSPDLPQLYTVRVMLDVPGGRPHTAEVRTGFREAVFRDDGFYLNGERRQIFGLNRHQLFPYTGMAAAARLQRRDAEILKFELNCNMVRCSHYPQSPHFLDACDELGLMVWQEAPGWQYVGGPAWRDLVVDNVRDMVVRDRSRPSVILWGTRLNETADHPGLYTRTRQAAEDLDGTRQTTGATFRHARPAGMRTSSATTTTTAGTPAPSSSRRCPACPTWSARPWGRWTGRRPSAGSTPGPCWPSRPGCTPRCTTSPGPTRGTPGCSAGRRSTTRRSTAASGSGTR